MTKGLSFLAAFSLILFTLTNANAAKVVGTPTSTNMNFGQVDVTFYGTGSGTVVASNSSCTNSGSVRLFSGTGCTKATVTVTGTNYSSGSPSTSRTRFRVFRTTPINAIKGSDTLSVAIQLPTTCTGTTPGTAAFIDCDFPTGTGTKTLTFNVFGTLTTTGNNNPGLYTSTAPFISICSCSNVGGTGPATCPSTATSGCYTF